MFLILIFSFPNSNCINHSRYAPIYTNMVEELISSNHIKHHFVPLLTLCGKGIKQSQFPRETDNSESNFQPCKGKPNTHTWSTIESLPSNRLLLIPVHGQRHSPRLQRARPSLQPLLLQHKFKIPISMREWGGMAICRADQLLGLPRTIFTACS